MRHLIAMILPLLFVSLPAAQAQTTNEGRPPAIPLIISYDVSGSMDPIHIGKGTYEKLNEIALEMLFGSGPPDLGGLGDVEARASDGFSEALEFPLVREGTRVSVFSFSDQVSDLVRLKTMDEAGLRSIFPKTTLRQTEMYDAARHAVFNHFASAQTGKVYWLILSDFYHDPTDPLRPGDDSDIHERRLLNRRYRVIVKTPPDVKPVKGEGYIREVEARLVEVTSQAAVPPAPIRPTVKREAGQLTLSWEGPIGDDITFRVLMIDPKTGASTPLGNDVPSAQRSITVPFSDGDELQLLAVRDESVASIPIKDGTITREEATKAVPPPPLPPPPPPPPPTRTSTAPSVPSAITAKFTGNSVEVSWLAPKDTDTQIEIAHSSDENGEYSPLLTVPAQLGRMTSNNLPPTGFVRLTAISEAARSAASAPVAIEGDTCLPGGIEGLQVSAPGPDGTVQVSWSAPSDASIQLRIERSVDQQANWEVLEAATVSSALQWLSKAPKNGDWLRLTPLCGKTEGTPTTVQVRGATDWVIALAAILVTCAVALCGFMLLRRKSSMAVFRLEDTFQRFQSGDRSLAPGQRLYLGEAPHNAPDGHLMWPEVEAPDYYIINRGGELWAGQMMHTGDTPVAVENRLLANGDTFAVRNSDGIDIDFTIHITGDAPATRPQSTEEGATHDGNDY